MKIENNPLYVNKNTNIKFSIKLIIGILLLIGFIILIIFLINYKSKL